MDHLKRNHILAFLCFVVSMNLHAQTPNKSSDSFETASQLQPERLDQLSLGKVPVDLNRFFYFLPIDSCIDYILTKTADSTLFKIRLASNETFRINLDHIKDNEAVDSIRLEITCHGVGLGGSHNQASPVEYEQWLSSTIYFKSNSASFDFFLKQKTKLDSYNVKPSLAADSEIIEYTYTFASNTRGVHEQEIHLRYEIGKKRIRSSHRSIYTDNRCRCN